MSRWLVLVALALVGCGSDGGEGTAATEPPLCDPPADLQCPEGMRTETATSVQGDGTWCYEGDVKHPLKLIRDGAPFWYSVPPFDTTIGCWPPDVAETAYSYTSPEINTGNGHSQCYDAEGAPAPCEDVTEAYNEAWGL